MKNAEKGSLLLVAGIPASGKSHFCRWLAREHQFVHVDVEEHGRLAALGLERIWEETFSDDDPTNLIAALRALGPRVVLDWGFPPNWLHVVQDFKDSGADLWWFDADHGKARDEFVRRGTVPVAALDAQMNAIRSNWEDIRELFDPNILLVLGPDGRRMEPDAIWSTMTGYDA